MFSLDPTVIDVDESWKQIGLDAVINGTNCAFPSCAPPFATTSEIDDLLTTNPQLYSSGRTTGPKGGASCPLKLMELGVAFGIDYTMQGVTTLVGMEDIIKFFKPTLEDDQSQDPADGYCCNPSRGGDSGSALFADIEGTIKVIGLVFAAGNDDEIVSCDDGPNSYKYGFACRIDHIASQLGIMEWGYGEGTLRVVKTRTMRYLTALGGSADKFIECDHPFYGVKRYYQVGGSRTLHPQNCSTVEICVRSAPHALQANSNYQEVGYYEDRPYYHYDSINDYWISWDPTAVRWKFSSSGHPGTPENVELDSGPDTSYPWEGDWMMIYASPKEGAKPWHTIGKLLSKSVLNNNAFSKD